MPSRMEAVHSDLNVRYGPLAWALSGRRLQVHPAPDGERTHTNGRTIFLRRDPDVDAYTEIAVQCALIEADSLSPGVMTLLLGRPERARRYLGLEVARLCATGPALLKLVIGNAIQLKLPVTADRDESLRLSADRALAITNAPNLGQIRPVKLLAGAAAPRAEARQEDFRRGGSVEPETEPQLDDDTEADELPSAIKRLSSPINLPKFISKIFHQALGTRRGPGSDAPGMEIPTTSMRRSASSSPAGRRSNHRIEDVEGNGIHHLHSRWIYPEWDFIRARYRPDWCSVDEIGFAQTADHTAQRQFRRDHRLEAALMRLARGMNRQRARPDGADLDLDALVGFAADRGASRRLGPMEVDSPAIYTELRRTQQDMTTLVLIDISGSAAERSEGGRRIIDEQLQASAALIHALATTGSRCAALAFHSRGRDAARAITLKSFDEQDGHAATRRVLALEPSGYTRLGAGIRHSLGRLAADAGRGRRLLIVVSDGVPYDLDYSGSYGCEDVVRAVSEAEASRAGLLWICLGGMVPALQAALVEGRHVLVSAATYQELMPKLPMAVRAAAFRRPG